MGIVRVTLIIFVSLLKNRRIFKIAAHRQDLSIPIANLSIPIANLSLPKTTSMIYFFLCRMKRLML